MTVLGVFLNKEIRTGANRRYLELMDGLAARGIAAFVIMNKSLEYSPKRFVRVDVAVNYRRKGFPPASTVFRNALVRNAQAIKRRLAELGVAHVDWVHIHGDMHLISALYLKRLFKTRLFFAFRCDDIERARILRRHLHVSLKDAIEFGRSCLSEAISRRRERRVARFAECITFQNETDRKSFISRTGAPLGQTLIIPGNIGLPRFGAEWAMKNNSSSVRRLVYVGVLSFSKGLPYLVEALGMLKGRGYGNLVLAILGRRNSRDGVDELVSKFDVAGMVSFEGYTLPFPHLVRSDLMVFPTLYDAFPDAVLEALHVGCPVIASGVGGLPDMLKYPDLLFEPGSATAIADRIERCIREPGFYARLRSLCEGRRSEFQFDWAERFERAMRELG